MPIEFKAWYHHDDDEDGWLVTVVGIRVENDRIVLDCIDGNGRKWSGNVDQFDTCEAE